MSVNKWSQIDYRKPAHWWLGHEGTACGLDFQRDIRQAYDDDPRCRRCVAHLATHPCDAVEWVKHWGHHANCDLPAGHEGPHWDGEGWEW